MSDHDERNSDDLNAIDEIVRLQQRLALRWGRYTAESIERLQTGDLAAGTWLDAYGRFAASATNDVLSTLREVSKLRGAW